LLNAARKIVVQDQAHRENGRQRHDNEGKQHLGLNALFDGIPPKFGIHKIVAFPMRYGFMPIFIVVIFTQIKRPINDNPPFQ
jgi:hypothetical protein